MARDGTEARADGPAREIRDRRRHLRFPPVARKHDPSYAGKDRNPTRRVDGRLPQPADRRELFAALERVDDETLAVMCTTGPWETRQSGGQEIDVQGVLRVKQSAGAAD